ncbi:MAG TPA: hemerythrin domain-containing protein [Bryobacteraceae bacterium]|nr:hemerythrin domain-containing protein [Bryobacteraceae bacterium]
MFDWFLPEDHAISVIKSDHERLKKMFDDYEAADKPADRKKLAKDVLTTLKLHSAMEEEIFYPAIRPHVGVRMMDESDEEHHVARLLIAEIDAHAGDPGHLDAKFTVLAENIRHHIDEEEEQVLPKAQEMKIDFEALGRRMIALRGQLLRTGIPDDAEHLMVAKIGKKDDTPAKAARKSAAKHATKKKAEPTRRKAAARAGGSKRRASR